MTRNCEIWKKSGKSFRDLPICVKSNFRRNIKEILVCQHYPDMTSNSENFLDYAKQYMQDPRGFYIDNSA